jgi:acetylornithine deacetylase/succinyl-diaminopimelate desuccinylase-like protein
MFAMMSRHPTTAAIALLATAALLAAARPANSAAAGPLPPDADQTLAREIFSELIGIRSTHDVGSTRIAQAIAQRLRQAGFGEDEVTVIAPPDHPDKGNVIVHVRAARSAAKRAPVLFLGHLDVVEARREDWTVDPFTLMERDGWFYGRGSVDMKNGITALVESLIRLRREHYVPERDLIIAMTADEEAGGTANGPAFLLREHRALIDAGVAINLDGGGGTYVDGKRLWYTLGSSEKVYATWTLEATSAGGHGAVPTPDNAILRLAAALARIDAQPFPAATNATTRANFLQMATLQPGPDSADLRAVASLPMDAGAAARLSATPRYNAMLRTTCTPTLFAGGQAENALPQRARATIQCRLLPGDSAAQVEAALRRAVADTSLTLTLDAPPIESPESPPGPAILATAAEVVHSMWPGVPLVPSMSLGYTDARQTRTAGIPTYDLGGTWADINERRAHGRDERVGVREFFENVEYTYRLLKVFGRRNSP